MQVRTRTETCSRRDPKELHRLCLHCNPLFFFFVIELGPSTQAGSKTMLPPPFFSRLLKEEMPVSYEDRAHLDIRNNFCSCFCFWFT